MLPILLRVLPPQDVGLWYVYSTIAQLSMVFEFGFSPVIGRRASYYLAGAETVPSLGLLETQGAASPNLPAIAALINMARGLYRRIALACLLSLLTLGAAWLMSFHRDAFLRPPALAAYGILMCATGANILSYFWGALLFGLNQVRLQQVFLIQGLALNYLIVVAGLYAGAGLISLALGQLVLGLYPRWRERHAVLAIVKPAESSATAQMHWRELWPVTWRAGVGSIAAYFSLPITTLICAQLFDLKTAASYGLSLQLALMVSSVSASWQAVTYPRLSALRTSGHIDEARRLAIHRVTLVMVTYVCLAAGMVVVAPHVLPFLKSRTQLLPPPQFALLFLACCVDLLVGAHAAIAQTGNHVPYLRGFLLTALVTVTAAFALGRTFGVTGLIAAPLCAQLLFNAWYTPYLCWRDLGLFRRRA